MIRLAIPRDERWLDLPFGVRVKVRPLTTPVSLAVRATATRRVRELAEQIRERREIGVPLDGLPDLGDPDTTEAYVRALYVKELARHGIVEWTGVMDEAGVGPAPVTAETVGDLMELPALADAFERAYVEPLLALVAEGNGSGPAPSGTSATGPDTVGGAGIPGSAAPTAAEGRTGGAVPTTSTSP